MDELKMVILYLVGVNLIAFILMGIDKRKSEKRLWRIPERTFWSLAIVGGAIGAFIGMKRYRHKTKHRSFSIGMPVLILIDLGILLYIYYVLS